MLGGMQFRNLLVLRRLFATAKTAPKSAKSTVKNVRNNSATSAASVDISKMPQPHPVLTPLTRRIIDQTGLPVQPAFESCTANIAYQVELDSELQKRLPTNLAEVSEHFGANVFVYRKDLIDRIRADLQIKDQIILDGPNGSGKSVILMNIYAGLSQMYCQDASKVLIYAPNAYKWTLGYFAYYPDGSNDTFKQPELAHEIMRLMLLCNGPEKMPEGFIEELQAAKTDLYNRAVPLLEKTMQSFADAQKQVYFILDGVNGLIDSESKTGYLDPDVKEGCRIPDYLTLKYFPLCNQFFNTKRENVKVIGALTRSHTLLPQESVESVASDPKKSLIKVPNYSKDELNQVLGLYSQLGHCSTNNKSDQFIQFKAFVSGSNGRKLFKSCEYDSIYSTQLK